MATQSAWSDQLIQEVSFAWETNIAWSNLSEDETILILIPNVPHLLNGDLIDQQNGFEDLRQAIATYHAGNTEVATYEPAGGITSTHEDLIGRCPTVLVVVSELPQSHGGSAGQSLVDLQLKFSEDVMRVYHIIHEGTEPDALVLLYCGKCDLACPENIKSCLKVSDHSAQAWTAVGKRLLLAARQSGSD